MGTSSQLETICPQYRKPSYGQPIDLGLCAVVALGGLRVVLTGERAMPFDTMHWRAVGIDPERERLVTMKCGSMRERGWSAAVRW